MKITILLLLSIALSSCGKKAPNSSVSKDLLSDLESCQEFRAKLPKDWFQNFIEVPEDPASPDGKQIKVFFYGKMVEGVTPVVFFNGGPGADSHGSYRHLTKMKLEKDIENLVSFIYIDQRGNGCSDPYPQGDSDKIKLRLKNYGSRGIVADAEAVRKKLLNDQQWIAFGQSYGGFIVHRYVVQAPDGLKAAFSHGGVITSNGFTRILNRIKSQTRVIKEYFKLYPEDQNHLDILAQELTLDTCFKDPKSPAELCGYDALYSVPELLAFKTDWEYLHGWIARFVKNGQMVKKEIQNFNNVNYFPYHRKVENGVKNKNLKGVASSVIGWADRDVASLNLVNCFKIKNELKKEGIDITEEVYTECAWAMQYDPEDTETPSSLSFIAKDKLTIEELKSSLTTNNRLHFYLYSGELDQMVPRENFVEQVAAVSSLENFQYVNFENSAHDGFSTENRVWEDLISEIKR